MRRRWLPSTLRALVMTVPMFLLLARPMVSAAAPATLEGTPVPVKSAVLNFRDAARAEALRRIQPGFKLPPVRPLLFDEEREQNEMGEEPGADRFGDVLPETKIPARQPMPMVASPSPTQSFIGLDDIAMVDSSFIVIPPDVGGAVGPTRILERLNNNLRILDKATGSTVLTIGNATFWAPVVDGSERGRLTDPRTVYDPYNNVWIVA